MGGVSIPAGASLPRLKALDKQPGLVEQLNEASILCNHGARAEMVLRWLLDKLKKSSEARIEPRAWSLLSNASRLIVPERLAHQLDSCDVLRIIQITLTVSSDDPSDELLSSIASFCVCLLQISRGDQSSTIESILVQDDERAAAFLGLWLRIVDNSLARNDHDHETSHSFVSRHSLLDLPFAVWDRRKTSQTESQSFSKECLVPAVSLMGFLSAFVTKKPKRTRDNQAPELLSRYHSILEQMLARHIFIPARAAFWKLNKTGNAAAHASTDQSPALEELLKPLDAHSLPINRLPALVEVSLRCVPITTLRQRLHERPWVEEVVSQLDRIVAMSNNEYRYSTLAQILQNVKRHRFTISKEMLARLAEESPGTSAGAATIRDRMQTLSQIIELDVEIYLDESRTRALFEWLCRILIESQVLEHWTEFSSFCCGKVVVPIMHAFAEQHGLPGFVDLWQSQLVRTQSEKCGHSFWTQFQTLFSQSVTRSMTTSQIQAILGHHSKIIDAGAANRDGSLPAADVDAIFASIVILDGVVGGLVAGDVLNASTTILGSLLQDTLGLFDIRSLRKAGLGKAPHIWTLLKKILNAWFPIWAMAQDSEVAVAERLRSMVFCKDSFSKAIQAAQEMCVSEAETLSTQDPKAVQVYQAADFLLSITDILLQYNDHNLKERAIELLQKHKYAAPALLKHPRSCEHFKSHSIPDVWRPSERADSVTSDHSKMTTEAFIEVGIDPSADKVYLESVISKISSAEENAQVQALRALSPLVLARIHPKQRQILMDTLTGLLTSERAYELDPTVYGHALSLLVQTLKCTPEDIALDLLATLFWKLVDPDYDRKHLAKNKHHPRSRDLGVGSKALLQEALRIVFSRLAAEADGERSHDMLPSFKNDVRSYCAMLSRLSRISEYPLVHLAVQTILQEAARAGTASDCVDKHTVTAYLQTILEGMEAWLHVPDGGSPPPTCNFQALLIITPELLQTFNIKKDDHSDQVIQIVRLLAKKTTSGDETDILAVGFRIGCRWSMAIADPDFLQLGRQCIADASLSPATHEAALRDFRSEVKRNTSSAEKVGAIRTLLAAKENEHASSLRLLQCVLSACTEQDFEEGSSIDSSAIFSALLEMARTIQSTSGCERAIECVVTVLREKSFMTNQFTIEQTISTLRHLLRQSSQRSMPYSGACQVLSALLQQYRSRLQDRMHLIVPVIQALVSDLFPQFGLYGTGQGLTRKPTTANARALSRVLQLLCNPPRTRTVPNASELVDHARKAQGHVGRHMQYVLHHYCTTILNFRLDGGVREALLPGLWAVIEAMEVGDGDAMKVLNAAMNQSERAVLRSLYEQYQASGKSVGV